METRSNYVTIKEAADLLGVTTTTLRNWDRAGKLTPRRDPMNRYRMYLLDDVTALLREREPSYRIAENKSVDYQTTQLQLEFYPYSKGSTEIVDARRFRLLVRQMSRAFRDSMGGGLLERFEEVTKLLYCKLFDEKMQLENKKRFYYTPGESVEDVYERISRLYSDAIMLLPEVFTNGNRSMSNDKKAVTKVVQILQNISLSTIPADVKGIVFEELVRNTFEKSENQQFFTPRTIVEFMVSFIEPTKDQKICDPACGSGGFLIEASNFIITNNGSYQEVNKLVSENLMGLEIDRRMAWVAQMNLIMHGDGNGNIHHLGEGGSLAFSDRLTTIVPNNSLDIILTNPPFGSDFTDVRHLANYRLGKGRSSRRRGILFIERCIQWLKPGGRLGIIIDDSVLNGRSTKDVRELILENCIVEAVISLPDVAFMPYATAKASILFLRKRKNIDELQPNIFMANVEEVGRKPNGDPLYTGKRDERGLPILLSDLPQVLEAWKLFHITGEKALSRFSPKIFICPSRKFSQSRGSEGDLRFDVQYNHPSRDIAEEILSRSIYPTPKLAELVVVRNSTVVPAKQDPDEVWNYVGLANIAAHTGEYTVSKVIGDQLKSTVRLYRPGDILFSKLRPELRKVVLISEHEDEGYASSECLVICTLEEASKDTESFSHLSTKVSQYSVDKEYLHFILRSDIVFGQLVYQVTGVGRPRVSSSTILGIRIPLPTLSVQREIVAAYKLAWNYQLECRKRSEIAMLEGEEAIKNAFSLAIERLCPQ